MKIKTLPIKFPGIDESIYAGFWRRFGAFWLDFMIMIPIIIIFQYINNLGKLFYYYTYIPNIIFVIIYHIYFVKLWGGTPGKLIAKIKIVRKDGKKADWLEASLRHIVPLIICIFSGLFMFNALGKISNEEYMALSFLEKSRRMTELSPEFNKYLMWTNNIWIWSEFLVLLLNKRKRALHDYIAGTVVIKKKYEKEAEQAGQLERV